jgi:N4-gp56 family major capsid protein
MAAIQGSPATALQYGGANQAGVTLKPDAYYDKLLLTMLRQMEFEYGKYAVEKTLPRNFGDTINWRRFLKLDPNTTPLTEGVTPDGLTVSGTSVQAVIKQYGDVMYFTDLVDLQQLDDVKREYTVELGYLAKETMDLIIRNTLVGEGSAFFAGGNTAITGLAAFVAEGQNANDDRPKIDDFRKIVLGMKRAYLKGNRKANGRYVALISPEVMFQLFDDERMKDYMDFGQTNAPFADGMTVDMFGIRFTEVLNAPIVELETAGVAAHDSIIIAEEAYAITKLQGQGVRVITKGLGSAGVEDPLDQRQSIGWKMTGFAVKVLNNEAVVNYWSVPGDVEPTLEDAPNLVYVTFVSGENANADTPINFRNSVVPIVSGDNLSEAIEVARITFTVNNSETSTVPAGKELAFTAAGSPILTTADITANTVVTVTLADE